MANIVCFTNFSDQYHITYNNAIKDDFLIHTENGIVRFGRTKEGLYTYRLPKEYKEAVLEHNKKRKEMSNFTTLSEHRGNYSNN